MSRGIDLALEHVNLLADDLHVFVGPTLSGPGARDRWPVVWHGPAERFSLARAVRAEGARQILLIDGLFESRPSVWHREILWCLEQGCMIYGCSSMGALRAAESSRHGMIGIGKIYESYARAATRDSPFEGRRAVINRMRALLPDTLVVSDMILAWLYDAVELRVFDDDDDVALIHGTTEVNYMACGFALCDLVFSLQDSGFPQSTKLTILAVAKQLYFKHRSPARLLDALSEHEASLDLSSVGSWLLDGAAVSQKTIDAETALDTITLQPKRSLVPIACCFEENRYWRRAFPYAISRIDPR